MAPKVAEAMYRGAAAEDDSGNGGDEAPAEEARAEEARAEEAPADVGDVIDAEFEETN